MSCVRCDRIMIYQQEQTPTAPFTVKFYERKEFNISDHKYVHEKSLSFALYWLPGL